LQGHSSPHQQCIFWDTTKVCLTTGIVKDLHDLSILLKVDTPHSQAWCRLIRLLIPHPIQFTFLSDASYEGTGGWSPISTSCGASPKQSYVLWASPWSWGWSHLQATQHLPFILISSSSSHYASMYGSHWHFVSTTILWAHITMLAIFSLTTPQLCHGWPMQAGSTHRQPTASPVSYKFCSPSHPFISNFSPTIYLATPMTQPTSSPGLHALSHGHLLSTPIRWICTLACPT